MLLEARQTDLVEDNIELKKLCLYLDSERKNNNFQEIINDIDENVGDCSPVEKAVLNEMCHVVSLILQN